jgi:phosphatidylinositol 4-kinase type 2
LTRRTRALVWDDELELDEDSISQILHDSHSVSPQSINTLPLPGKPPSQRRSRSQSGSGDFPPPSRRAPLDHAGSIRPVPFSAKFQKVHPGTTGVRVLEHLERLDAVEASLERLTIDDILEEIEEDVGESSTAPRPIATARPITLPDSTLHASGSAPSRAGAPELAPVPEADSPTPSTLIEEREEDVVAMSKSLSHLDTGPLPAGVHHGRGTSSHSAQPARRTLDWMQDEPAKKRMVISEVRMMNCTSSLLPINDLTLAQRLEVVTTRPLFRCC